MFSTLNIAVAPSTAGERACDLCRQKKVRCDMGNPCKSCTSRNLVCTFDTILKKRGPISPSTTSYLQSPDDNAATNPVPSLVFIHEDPSLYVNGELDAIECTPPSLPIGSPSSNDSSNLVTVKRERDLSPVAEAIDVWPRKIGQDSLLPWLDVYFQELHPTVPVLSRTMIHQEMHLQTHHHDPQFGAMLLALCAFAMTQPVQSHEEVSTPSRSVQARMLLEESLNMRMTVDFGESPTVYMVLTSFFIFAFLFGSGQHRAANHRLREAVDLALSMDMDKPQAYDSLDPETRDQWLRTYLHMGRFYQQFTDSLHRTFALQKRYTIKSRGSPTANACFIRAFGSFTSYSAHRDKTDSMGMISLLYLMEAYNAIDESVVGCWAGYCKYSYGHCEDFDRRLALRMFRAQERAREDWLAGSISSEPSTPLPSVHQLLESQQVDIVVTHFWLLNKIWELRMSHGLLRDDSEHRELRLDFAYHVAYKFGTSCHAMNLHALEFHGVGIVEKIVDITMGLIKALNSSTQLSLESSLTDYDPLTDKTTVPGPSVRLVLGNLHQIVQNLRGGSHDYVSRLTMALEAVPGYNGAAEPHHSVA
ncbi:hypothetical protein D6D10_00568 [Aureobasidium pullulans]|uniref:Zn(2)-C6 fungal-type domain-containing protein n=1 Tax=Aureobasidium pullulans TaxID=5580 RepID=A0A4S9F977_AURPU|nr:hypothetical protein D6D10_00568 [Aureobasidium pullulans]